MQIRRTQTLRDAVTRVKNRQQAAAFRMLPRQSAGGTISGFGTGFRSPWQGVLQAAQVQAEETERRNAVEFWASVREHLDHHLLNDPMEPIMEVLADVCEKK